MTAISTPVENAVRQIPGGLSGEVCQGLYNLAADLPSDSVILDLSPGCGLSTVVLAQGVTASGVEIVSVDTHVTDPLSDRPLEDGTLMPYLAHLRTFKVMDKVTPVVAPIETVERIFNKKLAALVVIQIPRNHVDKTDALWSAIQTAEFVLRKRGKVAVLNSDIADFKRVAKKMLKGYSLSIDAGNLLVFEAEN